MFERLTGFFRRFRSKRTTAETTAMDSMGDDFDDFGLDDSDFGDAIGTEELDPADLDQSLAASLPGVDVGGAEEEGLDTFDTISSDASSQETSLSGGSGEGLLEDSLGGAETFETLAGDVDAGLGGDDFGGGFDDFGEDAADLDMGGEPAMDEEPLEAEPAAGVNMLLVLGLVVGGLVIGPVLKVVVMPLFSGTPEGPPLAQVLAKTQSDARKAARDLKNYQQLGGIEGIQKLKKQLDDAKAEYATVADVEAEVEKIQQQEQAYDLVIQQTVEAGDTQAQHDRDREALTTEITAAEVRLATTRTSIADALGHYHRQRRQMEAAAVVADAFASADRTHTMDQAILMLNRPVSPPAGTPAGAPATEGGD